MSGAVRRIVVFGAGGGVGGWICEELLGSPGVELVASVRRWSSAVRLARRGIQLRIADLANPADYAPLLSGADAVINASMLPPAAEPELVTQLYTAAQSAGVGRFVQFSSATVYGDATGVVDEAVAPAPLEDYGRGKARMEAGLAACAAGSDVPVVILRPSIIYGPFSDGWTVRYVDRIKNGRWRELGAMGTGKCNLVYGQDVARAAIAAATCKLAPGAHILNVNGPETVTWNEYIRRLGDALGVPGRTVPNAIRFRSTAAFAEGLRMIAKVEPLKAWFRRRRGAAQAALNSAKLVNKLYPSAGELRLLKRDAYYPGQRAVEVLGYAPATSLEIGIRQSIAWCRLHGVA